MNIKLNLLLLCSFLLGVSFGQKPKLMLPIGHTDEILCAQFSPDGKKAVTGSVDKTLKIWDVETGVLLANLKGHSDNVNQVSYSPKGEKILSVSKDGSVKVWDAVNGNLLHTIPPSFYRAYYKAVFIKNGTQIITFTNQYPSDYKAPPDSKYLVYIYDAVTYKLLNRISGRFDHAELSPDEKTILCWGPDEPALSLWDITVPGGKKLGSPLPIYKFAGFDPIQTAGFSPDGTMAYCIQKETQFSKYGLCIWKIKKGNQYIQKPIIPVGYPVPEKNKPEVSALSAAEKEENNVNNVLDRVFKPDLPFKDSVSFVSFSSDNKKLLIGSVSGTVIDVFNLTTHPENTGKNDSLIFQKRLSPIDGYINSVSFSNDNRRLLSATQNRMIVWDLFSDSSNIINQNQYYAPVSLARFSNDDRKIIVLPTNTFPQILSGINYQLTTELAGHTAKILTHEFSPDGKYLLAAIGTHPVIWDNNNGQLLKILGGENGHQNEVSYAKYSPDGKLIITASKDFTAKIWNATTGKWITDLVLHSDEVYYAAFSPDGKRIITASADSTYGLWNWDSVSQKASLISRLKGHEGIPRLALFSKDSKKIVTVSVGKDQIKMWGTDSGNLVFTIENKNIPKVAGQIGDSILSVMFSPDNKQILTTSFTDQRVLGLGPQIWDANDGHFIKQPILYDTAYNKKYNGRDKKDYDDEYDEAMEAMNGGCLAYFNNDGTKILYLSNQIFEGVNYAITGGRIVDAKTFKTIARLKDLRGLHQNVNDVSFSSNDSLVAISFVDNTTRVFDMATGKTKYNLVGHSGDIYATRFSPDDKYVVTISEDNTFKKWNTANGELLYTFLAVDSSDYLVLDKYDRFDGTPAAKDLLYFSCGTEMIKLEQFETLSWEPDLVKKILKLNKEPITAKKISEIDICNVTPEVILTPSPKLPYKYLIVPQKGKLGEVQVYVNDKIVEVCRPADLKNTPQGYVLQLDSNFVASFFSNIANNNVMVRATTENEAITSRGVTVVSRKAVTKKGIPNMYIVSVGINDYKGKEIHLNYASNDASSFSAAITASAKKLLDSSAGESHVRSTLFNTEPENLNRPFKAAIRKKMSEIAQQALPDDIFIFFFAGHGVLQNGQKSFYLLTAEATGFDMTGVEKEVAISTDELNEWMRQIKANKQLLILDACNSGAAIDGLADLISKRDIPADQVRALEGLKDKNGTFILSASASNQSAYETSQFGQGLLTYSLLSGIKNQNGLRDYQYLDVTGWFNKTSDNVRELAKEIGGRQEPKVFGKNNSFDVGKVDEEIMNGIKLASRKKIITRSVLYTGDPALVIDELQLGPEIDRELNNRSASGIKNPFTYIENNLVPETFSIRGSYEIADQNITVKLALVSKKNKVLEIIESGTLDTKVLLARKIVDDVVAYINSIVK